MTAKRRFLCAAIRGFTARNRRKSGTYENRLLGNASYKLTFEQMPQVNVPVRYEIEDGGEVTIGTGAAVDLWSLGETIVKKMAGDKAGIEDWSVRYDQINGSVTYQWMKNVGTEENPVYEPVSESTSIHVTNGLPDGGQFPEVNHTFTSDVTGNFPFVLKTTFTPDPKSDTWNGENDGAVGEVTKYGNVMVRVVKATDVQVVKYAADEDGKRLDGAVFTLSKDGKALTFTDLGNGTYALSGTGTQELTTAKDGKLNLSGLPNGEYTLCEIKAPEGYAADADSMTFATENGEMKSATPSNGENQNWTFDLTARTIALKDEVWTEPTPTPTPPFEPLPTPPAAGNDTSVTVHKTWSDEGNKDGKRPVSITVQLQMNGKLCGEPVTRNLRPP